MENTPLSKAQVARTLSYLRAITPMVAADYVKLLPTSYIFETPEEIPFTYSETSFAERIPGSLHDFFQQKAIVESGKKVEKGILFDGSLEVGRIISISFKDHDYKDSHGYTLLEQEVIDTDKDTRMVQFRMTMPDTPPEKAEFDAWVYQSINQTAGNVYQRILLENTLSVKFGAAYLTKSPFVFELLEQIVPVENKIQTNTVNVLLNMDLPFLDGIEIEALMRVRSEEGEAFDNFRIELDKQLRELRQVKDAETLKIKTENIVHELTEVQIRQLDQKITSLKKKFFAEAAIVVGSLCGAIQTGGLTLPLALLAASQGYKSLTEYRMVRGENPAFFLWQVLKRGRRD